MLNSPLRRASFAIGVLGVILLGIGAYDWLTIYPNAFLRHTVSVPDYPIDENLTRPSIVQVHRACTWTSEAPPLPPGESILDSHGPVVVADALLSIEMDCAKDKLAPPALVDARFLVSMTSTFRASALIVLRNEQRKSTIVDWYSSAPPKTGSELYRKQKVAELVALGVPMTDADSIGATCIRSEPRYCIESLRTTRVHLWPAIKSNWLLLVGVLLLIVGLSGSIFLTPLLAIWRLTLGRVINWISLGK